MDQHARQTQPLLHTPTQGADQRAFLLAQPDQFQHVVHRLLALDGGDLVARTEEIQVLGHLHVLVHAEEVRHVTNDVAHRVGLLDDIMPHHPGRARRGREKGRQNPQRGGLARAVGADEPEQIPAVHRQVQRAQRRHVAVSARQTVGLHRRDGR